MTTNAADPYLRMFGSTTGPEPDPPPPPAAAQPSAPVFGRRKDTARRVTFTLVTYRGDQEIPEDLTARADIDTASVFALGRSGGNLGAQITAIRNLLMRTLVDDDGISVDDTAEQVAPRPGTDPDDEDLVPVADLDDDAWTMSDAAWRAPDGAVFDTAADAADHARDHGSSLRRFAAIMDDDSLWVEQSALEEIIDYLMSQAADRPTKRSSGPSRSRRPKGR